LAEAYRNPETVPLPQPNFSPRFIADDQHMLGRPWEDLGEALGMVSSDGKNNADLIE